MFQARSRLKPRLTSSRYRRRPHCFLAAKVAVPTQYKLPQLPHHGKKGSTAGTLGKPSANFSRTRRLRAHRGDLPGLDTELSMRRRRIYKAHPACGWRASWSRAHSPRVYHTSYPVAVRRPALLGWASFRPCFATTPLPFHYPSVPHKPGVRTSASQALCHARHTHTRSAARCSSARPLQRVVRTANVSFGFILFVVPSMLLQSVRRSHGEF